MKTFLIILSILLIGISLYLLFKLRQMNQRIQVNNLKQTVSKHLEEKQKELSDLNQQITDKQNKILQLKNLQQQQQKILNEAREKQGQKLLQIQSSYQESIAKQEQIYNNTIQQKRKNIELKYQQYEESLKQQIHNIQDLRDQVQSDLTQLKSVYEAATAARLRQQEEQDKLSFYKIKLSDKQINDIINLQEWKKQLNQPSIVSKIIWSAYIMKPTSDLCNRVLGSTSVCGIYKITNKQTGDIYVGQSVNVADRWKQHVKCGLGIDASATNKLYNNMQKYGVWNFTFEILQKCTRDKLNEKERFWIQMYQSNKTGLNTTKGNK